MPAASAPYMDSVLAGIQGTSKLLPLGWDASLAPTFFWAFQILVLSSYQHLSLSLEYGWSLLDYSDSNYLK